MKNKETRSKVEVRAPASQKNPKGKKRNPAAKYQKPAKPKKEDSIKFSRYTPLTWTGKKEGGWIEVKNMDGKSYWVRRSDISFSLKCLSVQVKKSNLRTGPGSQFEKASVAAQKGDAFLDLGGEDGWTKVENSKGEQFWINLDHTWRPSSRMRMVFEPDKVSP